MALPTTTTTSTDSHPFFLDVIPNIEELGKSLSDGISTSVNTLIQRSVDDIRKVRQQMQPLFLSDANGTTARIAVAFETSLHATAAAGVKCVQANDKADPANLVNSFGTCLDDILQGINQAADKALQALQPSKTPK